MKRRFRTENIKMLRKMHQNTLCINNPRNNQYSIINLFLWFRPENLSNILRLTQHSHTGERDRTNVANILFLFVLLSLHFLSPIPNGLVSGMKIWVNTAFFKPRYRILCAQYAETKLLFHEKNVFWVVNNQYANTYWLQFIGKTWYMLWLKDGSNIKCSIWEIK